MKINLHHIGKETEIISLELKKNGITELIVYSYKLQRVFLTYKYETREAGKVELSKY